MPRLFTLADMRRAACISAATPPLISPLSIYAADFTPVPIMFSCFRRFALMPFCHAIAAPGHAAPRPAAARRAAASAFATHDAAARRRQPAAAISDAMRCFHDISPFLMRGRQFSDFSFSPHIVFAIDILQMPRFSFFRYAFAFRYERFAIAG